jgi:hypothetical protein
LEADSIQDIVMIKSVLDAKGIRYFLQGENVQYYRPLFTDPAVLMVAEEDVNRAIELLKILKLEYMRRWLHF